jgi:hypothetical protein
MQAALLELDAARSRSLNRRHSPCKIRPAQRRGSRRNGPRRFQRRFLAQHRRRSKVHAADRADDRPSVDSADVGARLHEPRRSHGRRQLRDHFRRHVKRQVHALEQPLTHNQRRDDGEIKLVLQIRKNRADRRQLLEVNCRANASVLGRFCEALSRPPSSRMISSWARSCTRGPARRNAVRSGFTASPS